MSSDLAQLQGFWQLVGALGFGFLTIFTPCVYPLIPVTLAIFGATADAPRLRSFLLSVAYVLGIAVTYTALGLFCAKTGTLFGSFLGNIYVVIFLVIFLILLALYTLELITLTTISQLQNRASRVGGKGYLGAFVMGTVSGLVAAPCAGPPLLAILAIAAKSGNALWGGTLLFIYSLGFGSLFLILGAFPNILTKLPKSGNWLQGVKFVMATALLMVAVFLLKPFIGGVLSALLLWGKPLLMALSLVMLAVALLAYKLESAPLKIGAATILAVSLYLAILPGSSSALMWAPNIEEAINNAKQNNTIAMVDLYADWCAACKELDAITFKDATVIAALQKYALGRVDFSTQNEATDKIQTTYSVAGLPCILFLDKEGKEIPNSRITGFLNPAEFLEHLKAIGNVGIRTP